MQFDPPKDTKDVQHLFFRVRDGLKLHITSYRARHPTGRPVICLPGLTRNGRDFRDVAHFLSNNSHAQRDVHTIDYRGRGLSEWDSNWKNYAVPIEALDVIDVLAALNIHQAAFIGTSRGGIITMVMAGLQPTAIGACILNDIGPVVESDGLIRISSYVGRIPLPRTWSEATNSVRDLNRKKFPAIPDEMWDDIARQWYNEKKGRPAPGYDPELKNALSVLDGPMPTLWPQFQALTRVPVMVIRGERSDILLTKTVEQMRERHPMFESFTVLGQGHAPFLKDKLSLEAIATFLQSSDRGAEFVRPALRVHEYLSTHKTEADEKAASKNEKTSHENSSDESKNTKRRPLIDRL